MGQDVHCIATWNGRRSIGTAYLETDELLFRGDKLGAERGVRLAIPLASIRSVSSSDGALRVRYEGGEATFALGAQADKWAEKLRSPKSLVDKLDVKPHARVWLWHLQDTALATQIARRAPATTSGRSAKDCDVVFVGVDSAEQLDRIDRAAAAIADAGAIWVVHPKGRSGVPDTAIFTRATSLGLTYTKVARISDTLSAEKLVCPRSARTGRGKKPVSAAETGASRRAPARGG